MYLLTVATELSAEATHSLDFTASTTFVRVQAGAWVAFTVHPRPLSIDAAGEVSPFVALRRYNVRVRARGVDMAAADFDLHVGTGTAEASNRTDTIRIGGQPRSLRSRFDWRWHQSTTEPLGWLELPTDRASIVWLSSKDSAFDLDAMVLEALP